MSDPIVAGSIAGIIGATVKAVISHAFFLVGVTNLSSLHHAQRIVFHQAASLTGLNLLMSFIAFIACGGMVGVFLAYIYVFAGRDYGYYKGAGFGVVSYFLLLQMIYPLVQPGLDLPQTGATVATLFATHIVYGLVSAHILLKYADLPDRRLA